MDTPVKAVGGLRIGRFWIRGNGRLVQDQAAKCRLDVAAWAAETVVKIEVAEGRIEVVAQSPADHPATQPDAFRIAGWAIQDALGFGHILVDCEAPSGPCAAC